MQSARRLKCVVDPNKQNEDLSKGTASQRRQTSAKQTHVADQLPNPERTWQSVDIRWLLSAWPFTLSTMSARVTATCASGPPRQGQICPQFYSAMLMRKAATYSCMSKLCFVCFVNKQLSSLGHKAMLARLPYCAASLHVRHRAVFLPCSLVARVNMSSFRLSETATLHLKEGDLTEFDGDAIVNAGEHWNSKLGQSRCSQLLYIWASLQVQALHAAAAHNVATQSR